MVSRTCSRQTAEQSRFRGLDRNPERTASTVIRFISLTRHRRHPSTLSTSAVFGQSAERLWAASLSSPASRFHVFQFFSYFKVFVHMDRKETAQTLAQCQSFTMSSFSDTVNASLSVAHLCLHPRVQRRAEQHDDIARPPHQRFHLSDRYYPFLPYCPFLPYLVPPHDGHDRLRGCLRRARDVVRKR